MKESGAHGLGEGGEREGRARRRERGFRDGGSSKRVWGKFDEQVETPDYAEGVRKAGIHALAAVGGVAKNVSKSNVL